MFKLQNEKLSDILNSFIKRKNFKEKRYSKMEIFLSAIPFLNNVFFISKVIKRKKYIFWDECFGAILMLIMSCIVNLIALNTDSQNFIFIAGVLNIFFWFIGINLNVDNAKYEKINNEEEVLGEVLNKEDFTNIINSFNKEIIKKFISNIDNKKGVRYKDLKNLDELITNKDHTLKELSYLEMKYLSTMIQDKEIFCSVQEKIDDHIELTEEDHDHEYYSKIISKKIISKKKSYNAII